MEHNAVMRPLRELERQGIELTIVPTSPAGELDPADIKAAIRPNSRMIVLNHASNVVGTRLPVAEAGQIAREHDLLLLVDAAQTGGAFPIDVQAEAIDLLAFTGHKSLYGPMGTGGLVIGERVQESELHPLKRGGTGSRSELEEQPDFFPDMCESGTPNAVGLAGLNAGVRWVLERTPESIHQHEMELTRQLMAGLQAIPGLTLYGTGDAGRQTATVSFTVDGISVSEMGSWLDEEFGVLCRVGLHCSPAAHRTLGTFPHGTVRFGLGALSTADNVSRAVEAVAAIARSSR
jgi:selenocysteine lyase/cysteine desulfurase